MRKDELLVILDVVSPSRDAALVPGGGGAVDLLPRGRIVKEDGRLMTTTAAGRKMNDVCASKTFNLRKFDFLGLSQT